MGQPERNLSTRAWAWLSLLCAGLGLAAAAGVVSRGDHSDTSTTDVLPAAAVGAMIALVLGAVIVGLLRDRPAVRSIGAPTMLLVIMSCGALISIAAATDQAPGADTSVELVTDDGVEVTPGRTPAAPAGVGGNGRRDRRDISDFQGSIVLASGFLLLTLAAGFLMRRSELRAVERDAVYLQSNLLLVDDEPDAPADDASIAEMLERSLAELLNETDPRLAIRAAYGSLLSELATIGAARHRYEGPAEHVARCLSAHALPTESITELLRLFEIARFSEHPITAADANRARIALTTSIAALVGVRT